MIKKAIMTNLCCCYFLQDLFLRLYQFYHNTAFIISNLQKDFHQDNLAFACLQFYKHNCLNIFEGNILLYTSKESIEMTVKDSHSISSSGTFKPRKLV